jgi:aminoglycoside phosphotransferase (APT) family kinase protein
MDLDENPKPRPGPARPPDPPRDRLNVPAGPERAAGVLERGWGIAGAGLTPVPSGWMNQTFLVDPGGGFRYALQRINPVFPDPPALSENWDLAARALDAAGLASPVPVPTVPAAPAVPGGRGLWEDEGGDFWRLTAFVPGRPPSAGDPDAARAAGEAMGLAHRAWNRPRPLELHRPVESGELTNQRLCARSDFEDIILRYRGHPRLGEAEPQIWRGADQAAWLPARPSFVRVFAARDLVVHRDAKMANFLIGPDGRAAIIDLDTVGFGDPLIDLGEMWRSWSTSGAGAPGRLFDAALAKAVADGYRRAAPETEPGRLDLLPAVTRALAVNLARRYLTDCLAEVHFKWDRDRHPSLHAQNLTRGARCLDLAEELLDREIELMAL